MTEILILQEADLVIKQRSFTRDASVRPTEANKTIRPSVTRSSVSLYSSAGQITTRLRWASHKIQTIFRGKRDSV